MIDSSREDKYILLYIPEKERRKNNSKALGSGGPFKIVCPSVTLLVYKPFEIKYHILFTNNYVMILFLSSDPRKEEEKIEGLGVWGPSNCPYTSTAILSQAQFF